MKIVPFCLLMLGGSLLQAQERPAYVIFSEKDKPVSYHKMMKALEDADIVFFGELHDNALAHWLELQVLKDLHATGRSVVMGLEMFNAADQLVLDEYLSGLIDENNFLAEASIWENYETDYKPLIDFARQSGIQVVATNVPRRYANLVYRKGLSALDSLSPESREWMAPLPLEVDYNLPGYRAMAEGMGQHGRGTAENLVAAQALKDATMAYFILRNWSEGGLFYHINGAYHSQNREGIVAYLNKMRPGLKIAVVHTVEQPDVSELSPEHKDKGDFIICLPDDMTRTR